MQNEIHAAIKLLNDALANPSAAKADVTKAISILSSALKGDQGIDIQDNPNPTTP